MKRKIAFVSMTLIVSGVLYFTGINNSKAHDYGAPAGYTNSPHDGKSCNYSGCHTSYALQAKKPWISSNVLVSGYIPDSVYTFTAKAVHSSETSFGFEISPQTPTGNPLGTLIVTNSTTTYIVTNGLRQYITQTINGYTGSDSLVWTFQWKAPPWGPDSVTFYGSFNCGSGTSKSSGIIYPATLTIHENPTYAGIDNVVAQSTSLSVFPNPARERFTISYYLKQITNVEVNMYGTDGRKISIFANNCVSEGQHIQNLALPPSVTPGIYFIQLIANGQSTMQRIIVE